MINHAVAIHVPTSVSAGAGVDVSTMGEKCVYLAGTFTATVQFQLSADGANWINEGAALTAVGTLEITKPALFVRANVTAYTSGTPSALCVGEVSTEGGRAVTAP